VYVSLRTHLLALLAAKDLRDQQRFTAQTEEVKAALISQEKALRTKAEADDKRFELLNELRTGVATREQADALEKRINEMAARLDRIEGRSTGLSAGWGYLLGVVALIGAVVAFLGSR
jgi:hypothetical protein